jgi:hypothetical protein
MSWHAGYLFSSDRALIVPIIFLAGKSIIWRCACGKFICRISAAMYIDSYVNQLLTMWLIR